MTKSLKEILIEQKLTLELNPEYGTDKGGPKSYVEKYYEEKFLPFKDKDINLVEIGVRSGASICLWNNYFSNTTIYGLDNLDDKNKHRIPVNKDWVSGENIHYIIGDAYSKEIVDKLDFKIDILIDDGPHTFDSHVRLLDNYISKMRKGGTIIIEDISYSSNELLKFVPDNLKHSFKVYDFGGYDNRIIEISIL